MIRVFKSKGFHKLARKEKIDDEDLINAIKELESGLFDADLGGRFIKNASPEKGKHYRSGRRRF